MTTKNHSVSTRRILIVDDEPQVTMVLASILEKLGDAYLIETTNDSTEVLEKIQQADYALVITDYKMPRLDGLDLAKAIKAKSPHTHIILMTAFGSSTLQETVSDLRLDGYLDKPFTVPCIRELVTEILDLKQKTNKILIMEDNVDLNRLYKRALTREGYTVHTATTLQEARDLIAQHSYAAFLCDIHVGRERGTDLLRERAETLHENGTQIIMVSGDAQYHAYTEELGVEFYMEKPIAIETLITIVNRLVR